MIFQTDALQRRLEAVQYVPACVQHRDHATTSGEDADQLCCTCGLHSWRQVSDGPLTISYGERLAGQASD